jgi:hypothetical protein
LTSSFIIKIVFDMHAYEPVDLVEVLAPHADLSETDELSVARHAYELVKRVIARERARLRLHVIGG